jgi:hypothetical protein
MTKNVSSNSDVGDNFPKRIKKYQAVRMSMALFQYPRHPN